MPGLVDLPMIPNSIHSACRRLAPQQLNAGNVRMTPTPWGPALLEQQGQSGGLVVAPGQLVQRVAQDGQQSGQRLRGSPW